MGKIANLFCYRVSRKKKDKFTLETGEAKCTATAVLYDAIEPEIKLTFVSPLRGNNEEKETKTTQNKQIIDSDIKSYVKCPNNVYDKMFVSRLNLNQNEENTIK